MIDHYAVVGMGSIANRHISNLKLLYPESKIFSVSSSGKNSQLPKGSESIVSLAELIDLRPRYVIIASPAPYHTAISKKLLEHNIPLLIEKPLSDSMEDALEFKKFTDLNNVAVRVGYCLRFLPAAQYMKKMLDEECLGVIYNVQCNVGQYLPDWRKGKNYRNTVSAQKHLGGGVLLELSHELDYLNWFFGGLSLRDSYLATTKKLNLDVEEIADLVFISAAGSHIAVHLDFLQKPVQRKCEIIGEKGRITWDVSKNTITLFTEESVDEVFSDESYDKNNMYLNMLKTFDNIVITGDDSENMATISSSLEVMKLIQESKDKARWRFEV